MLVWKPLTSKNTLVMKGIAILMIAIHNFMHLFPLPKENEFDFSFERTSSLFHLVWTEPENSVRVLFSYFGHFGVQVFIFLSAYGLTKKYLNHHPEYLPFILSRIRKIFPSFLIAIFIWLSLEGFYSHGLFGPFEMLSMHYEAILLKLALVSNFIPNRSLDPIGPWWFIPFIFQFYFVFPFLLKAYERWKSIALISLSVFCLVFSHSVGGLVFDVNLYFTIIPYIPVFSLGIYLAKEDEEEKSIEIPLPLILFTLCIYALSNIYYSFWMLSNISFTILFMILMNALLPKIKSYPYKALIFTGQISMALFLVNGFLRFPMARWAIAADHWLLTLALCSVFLIISYMVAITLCKIEVILYSKIKKVVYFPTPSVYY